MASRWPRHLLLVIVLAASSMLLLGAIPDRPGLRSRGPEMDRPWPTDIAQAAQEIDAEIRKAIENQELAIAPAADWPTICRRLSLSLVGCSMSLQEMRVLEGMAAEHRLDWWTDYLLSDPRWSDYFAVRFSRAFVGNKQGPFLVFRRRKFERWLADAFRNGMPYDEIVRRMVTAEGLWTDHPEVNFLTASITAESDGKTDPIVLAGRTTRAFLGMRMDCLQCHDDMLGNITLGEPGAPTSGKQLEFHELAAFYGGTEITNGIAGLHDSRKPYQAQLLGDAEPQTIEPAFPFQGIEIPKRRPPRHALAAWLTDDKNACFARATVNRVWGLMLGKPLVEPVDDIPLHGPYPAGLERLASFFVESDYDLRALIRVIARTDTFRRDSRMEAEPVTVAHEKCWAVFPLTPLRPEQIAASLHQASRLQIIDEESSILARLERFGTLQDFVRAYGERGDDEFVAESVTIPQRLLVMNGKFVRERVEQNPLANASSQIAMLAANDHAAIDAAYLASLNRYPSPSEREAFTKSLAESRRNQRARTISDLFWMLMNSTEFSWNH